MSKHTQGPWIPRVADGGYLITALDGRTVCALPTIVHSFAEQAANAELIAMAPDLLSSLAEIVDAVRRTSFARGLDDERPVMTDDEFDAALDEALALLDLLAEPGVTVEETP